MAFHSRIILASRSPARKKLLQELGFRFEIHGSGYPEDMMKYKASQRLAKFLALEKAKFIAEKFPSAILIGADTFITVGKVKIGKPDSLADAKRIIRSMSGKTIKVHSGVAVIKTNKKGEVVAERVGYALTLLKIKKMTEKEVDQLAHQEDALQISGAFSIEGEGGKMVEKISGDYNNVIGLPLFVLRGLLEEFLAERVGFEPTRALRP